MISVLTQDETETARIDNLPARKNTAAAAAPPTRFASATKPEYPMLDKPFERDRPRATAGLKAPPLHKFVRWAAEHRDNHRLEARQ